MDHGKFDGVARIMANGHSRRRALQAIAAGAIAGLLGGTGDNVSAAGCVKAGKKGCQGRKDGKCCAGAICRGGSKRKAGTCACKFGLTKCGNACVDTQKNPKHCGACNTKCAPKHSCQGGYCTSVYGCPAGMDFCASGVHCYRSGNPNCNCITDVHGTPRCADFTNSYCATCNSNADCGPNQACFEASFCGCGPENESNGNGCVALDCNGVEGS